MVARVFNRIKVYSLYFFEYLKYGEFHCLFNSIYFMLTRKSAAKGGLVKTSMGLFNTRPKTLDFQYINYAYEIGIKHFIENKDFDVFIDAGACIGEYSIWLAKKGKMCFAFEPITSSYAIIKDNIKLNNLTDKISVFNFGLGKQHAYEYFLIDEVNFGASKKVLVANQKDEKYEICTFDEILPKLNIDSTKKILFKIDVEGMEAELMEGAKNFIQSCQHLTFIIEEKISGMQYLKNVLQHIANFEYGKIDDFNIYAKKITD